MVATTETASFLGRGLYTSVEAALYARIHPQTMTRWIYGNQMGERVIRGQVDGAESEKLVTFVDFVQALAVHDIRQQHRVPLGKIRDAVKRATDRYQVEYPLARQHTTFLYATDIFIQLPGDDDLTQLTGKQVDQMAMIKIVELYLQNLSYDSDGLAAIYRAYQWEDIGITMNPQQRFGEPLLLSCQYTAQALWDACKSEGSFEAAAGAYGVTPREVEAAYRYYDYLQGRVAA